MQRLKSPQSVLLGNDLRALKLGKSPGYSPASCSSRPSDELKPRGRRVLPLAPAVPAVSGSQSRRALDSD
jgi:hypothetical protein